MFQLSLIQLAINALRCSHRSPLSSYTLNPNPIRYLLHSTTQDMADKCCPSVTLILRWTNCELIKGELHSCSLYLDGPRIAHHVKSDTHIFDLPIDMSIFIYVPTPAPLCRLLSRAPENLCFVERFVRACLRIGL